MPTPKRKRVGRRGFLKGAAVGAAAVVVPPTAAQSPQAPTGTPGTAPANERVDVYTTDRPGADFMVDVIKSLGFEYVAANPGSSFRALHESLINYGGNKSPELLTCCHEESSVAMAHGYAKIEGKPMMVMAHGTVGLQHASMAIYNAFADRVPVYIVIGNILDATFRRSDVEWTHAVQDATAMVRDYIKWDDTPVSLPHFAESSVRAYRMATTPPYGPVVIVADAILQEEAIAAADRRRLRVPRLTPTAAPAADAGAVAELAKLLVAAEHPHLSPDGSRERRRGLSLLVELAELLQAPVVEGRFVYRMNFPTRHPLKMGFGTALAEADLVVALEHPELFHYTHTMTPVNRFGMDVATVLKPGAKIVTISSHELLTKSNYQDAGPLYRSGPGDSGRHGSHVTGVDRGVPSADHARPQARVRRARQAHRGRDAAHYERRAGAGRFRLGRQPDFDRTAVGGVVESHSARGLVARVRRDLCQQLAAEIVGFHETSPVHRMVWRVRHRLWRASGRGRGAGQSEARTFERQHPVRRRPQLRAGRVVDRGASPHPAAHGDAQ